MVIKLKTFQVGTVMRFAREVLISIIQVGVHDLLKLWVMDSCLIT